MGQFKKGNSGGPGRPKGSEDWRSKLRREYLEPAAPELIQKAIEMAKAGDQQMIRLVLDKLLPNLKAVEVSGQPDIVVIRKDMTGA